MLIVVMMSTVSTISAPTGGKRVPKPLRRGGEALAAFQAQVVGSPPAIRAAPNGRARSPCQGPEGPASRGEAPCTWASTRPQSLIDGGLLLTESGVTENVSSHQVQEERWRREPARFRTRPFGSDRQADRPGGSSAATD